MSRLASVFGCRRDAEKVPPQTKSVPQRLKPRRQQSSYGTAEAVPLSKTDFSASSEAPRFIPKATAKEQLRRGAEGSGRKAGFSTARRTMRLSPASAEMTVFGGEGVTERQGQMQKARTMATATAAATATATATAKTNCGGSSTAPLTIRP
jgi:hypothetical protein